MFADLHAHILHDIDDGPKTLEESVALVECALQRGIERIIATPHFYGTRHGLEERTALAETRYNELLKAVKEKGLEIDILLGYEVRFFEGISRSDSLDKLCINGSKVILLELGYIDITEGVIDELLELGYCGYTVILAHIERYTKLKGFKGIKNLIKKQRVLSQVNAASLISVPFAHTANKLLKGGYVSVLSSDMHSVDLRPPFIYEAYVSAKKRIGPVKANAIIHRTDRLFNYIKNQED